MGRILEVLRQPEAQRAWPKPPAATPRPFRPETEASQAADAEIPFIEVGGLPQHPATAAPAAMPLEAREPFQVRFQPVAPATPQPLPARFCENLIAFHQPGHRISEQYRSVLCAITEQAPAGSPQVLLFTAPSPRAGTTTVLLNLAVTYARQNIGQIALVDTHFGRPAVAQRLGLSEAPGLQEVFAGTSCLAEALRETSLPNLFALTAGAALQAETAVLATETMRQVLRELRARFQWVFVDAPAWAGRPEVIALGSACDAVYLVTPQNHEGAAEGLDMLRLMPRHGTPLRGRIVTLQ